MLESPHQNRLIMENFDFKETFFNKKREMERERERGRGGGGGGGDTGVFHLVCRGARADPIPTVIVIMLWGRGGETVSFRL